MVAPDVVEAEEQITDAITDLLKSDAAFHQG
jgi:hypothetical protein